MSYIKTLTVTILALVMVVGFGAFAQNLFEPAPETEGNWNDAGNWSFGTVPTNSDFAQARDGGITAIVNTSAVAEDVQWGRGVDPEGDPSVLRIETGGFLTVARAAGLGKFELGNQGGYGHLIVSGGSLVVTNTDPESSGNPGFAVGDGAGGVGVIDISSGEVRVMGGDANKSRPFVQVGNGTNSSGTINITGGLFQSDWITNIGNATGAVGVINVSGTGTYLQGTKGDTLQIANNAGASGTLNITDFGVASVQNVDVGNTADITEARVNISGDGQLWVRRDNPAAFSMRTDEDVKLTLSDRGLLILAGNQMGGIETYAQGGFIVAENGIDQGWDFAGEYENVRWSFDEQEEGFTHVWAIPEPATLFPLGLIAIAYLRRKVQRGGKK